MVKEKDAIKGGLLQDEIIGLGPVLGFMFYDRITHFAQFPSTTAEHRAETCYQHEGLSPAGNKGKNSSQQNTTDLVENT